MNRGWTRFSWLCRFPGVAQLRNTWAGFIGFTKANAKYALLQQNGFYVLRFLAEDVGKCLDHVLDTILVTLAHRQKRWR